MRVHALLRSSTVNGPGTRAVIWLQGCNLGCAGCWNPETHSRSAGVEIPSEQIVDWVSKRDDIEGITFSGGEPMHLAPSLKWTIGAVRKLRPELSIGMFTGYSFKELEEGRFHWWSPEHSAEQGHMVPGIRNQWLGIKENLDFAIMGRYNQLLRITDSPLRSSSNQELKILSTFYRSQDFQAPAVEVVISPDGRSLTVTGFPIGMNISIGKE